MSEIKRIDIGEFRELGYLQEANRQFFHPHGLALEVTTCTEESDEVPTPLYTLALPAAQYERLVELVEGSGDEDLIERVKRSRRYDEGDSYLSGVWDYREDPEGIVYVFGCGGYGDSREKADRVAAERERRREARSCLFHGASRVDEPDVEPLHWTYPE